MIRFVTRFYPNIPFTSNPKLIIKQGDCKATQGAEVFINNSIFFAEKDKDPVKPAKEEQVTVKMPGFVHPETKNEEGYFTQKAKQQLEELKKKSTEKPAMTNPEKRN